MLSRVLNLLKCANSWTLPSAQVTVMKKWEIIHIPEKPPISTTEAPPSVDVVAAVIEPKFANTLVRRLNQIAPLETFAHIKRVRKYSVEGGKIELSIILSLTHDGQQLESIPSDILELVDTYQLSPFIAKVAKYAASSKEEWKEQCKLWPTSYHPPTYNIDGITGFSEEDSQSVFNFMKLTLELVKSGPQVVNAAVIVDPSVRQIISTASDQTHSWHAPEYSTSLETGYIKLPEIVTFYPRDAKGAAVSDSLLSNCARDKRKELYTGASCLYPWKWTEHQLYTGKTCSFHPLRHAALVAIEYAAARDRHLYPGSGDLQDHSFQVNHPPPSMSFAKKQKIDISKNDGLVLKPFSNGSHFETERPYLCTGFDIYLAWEPCPMCAMALVHQRIRRIFYAFPNINCGALGSVQRLQGERSLNHHYAVFRVLLPEKLLDDLPL